MAMAMGWGPTRRNGTGLGWFGNKVMDEGEDDVSLDSGW